MPKKGDDTKPSAWVDPDDAPELTRDFFERAAIWHGDTLIRPADGTLTKPGPGRPKSDNTKRRITLRLDPDVVERFQAGGPGWQSRMNAALRKAAGV